jgi:hypothetical protein
MDKIIDALYYYLSPFNAILSLISVLIWIKVYKRNHRSYRWLLVLKGISSLTVSALYLWITFAGEFLHTNSISPEHLYMILVRPVFSLVVGIYFLDAIFSLRRRRGDNDNR